MGKTLKNLLVGAGVLASLSGEPCKVIPFYGEPPQEPNVAVERVESGYNPKALALTTAITAIASGLTGFTLGYFLNRRKHN